MKSVYTARRKGFSLIELLAAIAVLSILGLVIVQITSAVSRTTSLSNRAIDADAQVRLAMERIGLDLSQLIKRQDTDFSAQNVAAGTVSNILLFLSDVGSTGISTSNNRGLSLIAYRVAPHSDNQNRACLVRAGKAIPWNATGSIAAAGFMGLQSNGLPLTFADTAFSSFLPAAGDFDVLAPGVIRLIVGFQLYPDNNSVTLVDGTVVANARGQIVYSAPVKTLTSTDGTTSASYIDASRIAALVIGLVAIDLDSLRLLNASQVLTLVGVFDVPANSLSPVQAWAATANNAASSAALSSVPLPARQSLRVFERFYPITPFASKAP
jgi:prepilin-type N-terminal cleavage/methylation domain-containing protein